jgi:hypothetical protein
MKNLNENMKKLKKGELETIKGGIIPIGCNNWNPVGRCCRAWDEEHQDKPTCAN